MAPWLQRLFGTSSKPAKKLRSLGGSRDIVRFSANFREPIELWHAMPRGSWALEFAARIGVPRGLIAVSIGDLTRHAESTGRLELEARSEVEEWTERFAHDQLTDDAFADGIVARVATLIDSRPDVREKANALHEAELLDRFREIVKLSLEYDRVYAIAHEEMAARVRARIDTDQIQAAWHGRRPSPYR